MAVVVRCWNWHWCWLCLPGVGNPWWSAAAASVPALIPMVPAPVVVFIIVVIFTSLLSLSSLLPLLSLLLTQTLRSWHCQFSSRAATLRRDEKCLFASSLLCWLLRSCCHPDHCKADAIRWDIAPPFHLLSFLLIVAYQNSPCNVVFIAAVNAQWPSRRRLPLPLLPWYILSPATSRSRIREGYCPRLNPNNGANQSPPLPCRLMRH